jgi:hypothetical protein
MRDGAVGERKEYGLSEVIGFVLIIGLIVVVASLYLTYGVPAQGRENEILHMNEVKDQFVSYKLSLDSLFTNNKVGTTVSNSFTLGTSGGYSQGTVGFIPVMSPINSGGVIAINQRTTEPETLNISSHSLIYNTTIPASAFTHIIQPPVNPTPPSELRLYIDTTTALPSDVSAPYSVQLTSAEAEPNVPLWVFVANLTPRYSYTKYATYTGFTGSDPYVLTGEVIHEEYQYNRTDLTIAVFKNGNKTIDDYIVYSNIQATPANYSVNVLDDAYGLKNFIGNESMTFSVKNLTSPIKTTGEIRFNAQDEVFRYSPIPLGSIEYRAQNNYWIPQNYYYQMGGVFLQQADGNTTYKLPPEITFSYDADAKKILTVNINALTIDQNNRGVVGGNSPVQIKSTLSNITPMPYVPGNANTKWIWIGVNTTNSQSRTMWKNYFDYTAWVAGIPGPDYTVGETGTESYILMRGNATSDSIYDINVIASNATYLATVHGIGGIVE